MHVTDTLEVVLGEVLPLAVNVDEALAPADVVQSVVMVVNEKHFGAAVTDAITGTPSVTGVTLNFTLDARKLRARDEYEAIALLTVQPNAKVVGVVVPIHCVT